MELETQICLFSTWSGLQVDLASESLCLSLRSEENKTELQQENGKFQGVHNWFHWILYLLHEIRFSSPASQFNNSVMLSVVGRYDRKACRNFAHLLYKMTLL